jgi:hypothetical protein
MTGRRNVAVPQSVLEAIKQGQWDFEPADVREQEYRATGAMPGTRDKLSVLAERIRRGLPLWHPSDRRDFDDRHDDYDSN